jgi:hypothetical protein
VARIARERITLVHLEDVRRDERESTPMAAARKPQGIGQYLPSNENGPSLEESGLEGQTVTIIGVAFENRRGRNGDYTLSVITLDDDSVIHTGSGVIADQLGMVPPDAWPLTAVFTRVRSQSNPRQSYWSVSDPGEGETPSAA